MCSALCTGGVVGAAEFVYTFVNRRTTARITMTTHAKSIATLIRFGLLVKIAAAVTSTNVVANIHLPNVLMALP